MATADQLVRVLALAQALSVARRGVVLRSFAEKHNWPLRSLYRDIKKLEAAGFPIVKAEGRFRLVEGWRPPGQGGLDRDEALALFAARRLMGGAGATSLGRALDRLWSKLSGKGAQASLVPDEPPWLALRSAVASDYRPHQAAIDLLQRAICERLVVNMSYRKGEVSSRRAVEPGELYFDPGLESLYCIAYCRLRQAVRIFAVHRISEVELTDEERGPRPELRSSVALQGAFRVWRGDHIQRVRLRFTARVAGEIRERQWHASQQLGEATDSADGAVELTMHVCEPAELRRWLLGFAADVRVLEPRWLAVDIAADHERAAVAMNAAVGELLPGAAARPRRTRGRQPAAAAAAAESTLSRSDTRTEHAGDDE